jgi:hypothetical protein
LHDYNQAITKKEVHMTKLLKTAIQLFAIASLCAALSACSPAATGAEGFPSAYGTPTVSSQGASNLSIMDLN